MEGWLSLPEETGGVPFALRFEQGEYTFLALGVSGQSIDIVEAPDHFSPEEHGLISVPSPIVSSFLRRSFLQSDQEEWIVLEPLLPESAEPTPLPIFDAPSHQILLKNGHF